MRRLAAILLAVLLLAGNLQLPAASEPAAPADSTVPAPATGGDTPPAAPKHIEGQRAPDGAPMPTPTAEHDKL